MSDTPPAAPLRSLSASVSGSGPGFGEFVALMALLMAITALSIDVMLPALPYMRDDFALADPNSQQLVVTSYVLGFAAGQLFQGPLSDIFGRKPVLLIGLAIYVLASFACVVAGSFETLLAARCLQGVANAAPRVVAVAVIRDIYGGRRMAEVMSFIMMIFIVVPVIAPSVGGAFLLVGSWHLIFAALCAIGLVALVWAGLRLPETRPPEARDPLSISWLGGALRQVVSNRLTLGYTLATGAIFGALMGYINSSQQVFVEVYGLGAMFPIVFGLVACAIALASFFNSRYVMRLGMRRISHAGLLGFVAVALLHLGIEAAFGRPPLPLFVAMLAISLFCFGLLMPNFNAIAMEPMGRIAGTASSFIGCVTTAVAAVIGLVIGQAFDGTVVPLIAGFAACGVLGLALVLVTERGRLFRQGV